MRPCGLISPPVANAFLPQDPATFPGHSGKERLPGENQAGAKAGQPQPLEAPGARAPDLASSSLPVPGDLCVMAGGSLVFCAPDKRTDRTRL